MKPKKDVFSSPEDKIDFIIALIVIIAFSIFLLRFLSKANETVLVDDSAQLDEPQIESIAIIKEKKEDQPLFSNSMKQQTKTIKIEDALLNEVDRDSAVVISDVIKSKQVLVDTISKTVNNDLKIATHFDSKTKSKTKKEVTDSFASVLTNSKINEIIKIKVVDSVPSQDLTKVVDSVPSQDSTIEEISNTTQEELIETTQEEPVETTSIKALQKTKIVESETFNCVIVIGAFKDASNKTAIVEKLRSLDYNHSEGTLRNGLNYVGVPVDCNDNQTKKRLLRELNETFGIQSWVKKI